jgi:hypothetical protein
VRVRSRKRVVMVVMVLRGCESRRLTHWSERHAVLERVWHNYRLEHAGLACINKFVFWFFSRSSLSLSLPNWQADSRCQCCGDAQEEGLRLPGRVNRQLGASLSWLDAFRNQYCQQQCCFCEAKQIYWRFHSGFQYVDSRLSQLGDAFRQTFPVSRIPTR